MSYIEDNLTHNEHILYKARISLMIYLGPLLYVLLAALIYFIGRQELHMVGKIPVILAALMLLVAFYRFGNAYSYREFTEIAVTNQRIIFKTGAFSRESVEFPLAKIESVIVEQTAWERIIDAGTVAAHGTGAGFAPVRFVDDPVVFRNKLNEAIADAKRWRELNIASLYR